MDKKEESIYIIGAGISGLIAAQVLESKGYTPIVIEASSGVGGRVKTDIVDGYQLDRGFQVLLDGYPKAKQYLDYDALQLQSFLPGAQIFKNGKSQTIGDPLRSLKLLLPTLKSSVGTFADKVKILKLNNTLQKQSVEDCFREPASPAGRSKKTTLEYLQEKGFSHEIITDFFKPFFSGIFLEPHLDTSSAMFEFVYKMFGEGMATLPKAGIEAIPQQLKDKLTQTTFRFDSKVKQVDSNLVTLENGEALNADYIIVATEASDLIPNMRGQDIPWKSCDTLYFTIPKMKDRKPLIGLVSDEGAHINNIFNHSVLETEQLGSEDLLSVTVVKQHDVSVEALVAIVTSELSTYCGIKNAKFLKHYRISKALPKLDTLRYDCAPSETQIKENVFLAGDYLLNGSLNAAMISGERAAQGALEKLGHIIETEV
ncbi:FAD-dependent oxidoreductase [Dokdonia sinensis]|uniref:FAD-dependent oxidoreductase n=1 Tax=Dokdonia sinensis TaxID=2479847 RepID=A0A3M0GE35_9FLAO|nr:NAD(P)/FAD-dependent oxidoreductase [Dokdonia sinensis]RMB60902.1 FAD-dependent oxidoreductase [Dokdonia sinensis]